MNGQRQGVFFALADWCHGCGVTVEWTSPHGPTGNAINERQHGPIMAMLRCLLLDSGFPPRLDVIGPLLEIVIPFSYKNTTNMSHELKRTPSMMAGRETPLTNINFRLSLDRRSAILLMSLSRKLMTGVALASGSLVCMLGSVSSCQTRARCSAFTSPRPQPFMVRRPLKLQWFINLPLLCHHQKLLMCFL